MAKNKSKSVSGTRTRKNPITGEVETVSGTKAGKKRNRLPIGHPLRTHDLHGISKPNKKTIFVEED